MENKKYKILVLSDLKNATSTILKSTVNFAKMIHGEVEFFHVKKATDVVDRESQLSAVRGLRDEYLAIEKKTKSIINPIEKHFNVTIKQSFSFGNVKQEIDDYIAKNKPDIIVLGKRKSSILKLDRDSITTFVLSKFKGSVLLLTDDNQLEIDGKLSLGFLNNFNQLSQMDFADSLMKHTKIPLKSFTITNTSKVKDKGISSDNKTIDFVFEDGNNPFGKLSNFISKSDVGLLCLDRTNTEDYKTSNINEVINKVNVSVLITANQKMAV